MLALFGAPLLSQTYESIVGYGPGTKVTDHNAIDGDQKYMETALGKASADYADATTWYASGGASKAYASFTVPALSGAVAAKAVVSGTNDAGATITGKTKSAAASGATTLDVVYDTTTVQASYVGCNRTVVTGCFSTSSALTVAGITGTVTPSAAITKYGRTLKGFSTGAKSKMNDCDATSASYAGCPYKTYKKFYTYYGDYDYADKWVSAALSGAKTAFSSGRGDADFSAVSDDATRREATKKGTAYMNVWMYVIREFEDAIDDCVRGCATCNVDAVHAWDEGVAFYAGSREGTAGEGSGKLVYALADKRCQNYKTCGKFSDSTTGTSKVNHELVAAFNLGKKELDVTPKPDCAKLRPIVDSIISLMTIPLIQGTLRYAYKVDKLGGGLKEKGEGAVFAAAVLPMLYAADTTDAATVYSNMKVGAASTDFAAVKAAFEKNYPAMGVTCVDIGGLWKSSDNAYYAGFSPCEDGALLYGKIAGYVPGSKVTDHNAVDGDQMLMEAELGKSPASWATAQGYYASGGASKAYASFTVPALSGAVAAKAVVTQSGSSSSGKTKSAALSGATTLSVVYDTTTVQASYVGCNATVTSGCFSATGALSVAGITGTVTPTAVTTKFGRTLKGFSTGAKAKMYDCSIGCPYKDYKKFYDYYGDYDYADKWVSAALSGAKTAFTGGKGDADFSAVSDDATRREAIKKGTAYMNVWMYVVREFEDAIDDCKIGCSLCNMDPVHAWDEGVAFYAGSREGTMGEGSGKLVYALADKRCGNYKTCGAAGDSTTGTSKVNIDLLAQFNLGKTTLLKGNCAAVRPIVDKIVQLMTIPLIQGTMRYAYKVDKLGGGLKEKGEGAVFAAAVLPMLHACSATAATTVYSNMKVGAASTDFAAVRAAFEGAYSCLKITCADVGGLWKSSSSDYYNGFKPCNSPPNSPPPPTPSAPTPAAPGKSPEAAPCFSSDTTACRLIHRSAEPMAAFAACFETTDLAVAERVPMTALLAGDAVLTADSQGELSVDRVIVNQHRAAAVTSPTLTLKYAAGNALSLTPDHVLLVDGAMKAARLAAAGSKLRLADGTAATVEAVVPGLAASVINPITTSGTILAAGPLGAVPVLASTYPEWSADFLLASKWNPYPVFNTMAYLMPHTTQAYYDAALEPLFNEVTKLHTSYAALLSSLPAAVSLPIVLAIDLLATSGLLLAPVALAAAIRRATKAK